MCCEAPLRLCVIGSFTQCQVKIPQVEKPEAMKPRSQISTWSK